MVVTCQGCGGEIYVTDADDLDPDNDSIAYCDDCILAAENDPVEGACHMDGTRDMFAAYALQAIIQMKGIARMKEIEDDIQGGMQEASLAYKYADAMMKARDANEEG